MTKVEFPESPVFHGDTIRARSILPFRWRASRLGGARGPASWNSSIQAFNQPAAERWWPLALQARPFMKRAAGQPDDHFPWR